MSDFYPCGLRLSEANDLREKNLKNRATRCFVGVCCKPNGQGLKAMIAPTGPLSGPMTNRSNNSGMLMLSSFIAVLGLAFSDANAAQGPPPLPTLPDWRYEFALRPKAMTLTSEWLCGDSSRPSMAKVAIEGFYDAQRKGQFRVSLAALHVQGIKADRRI